MEIVKQNFQDCLMYTNAISGEDESRIIPSLILMKVNVNTIFGASIMPQNLSSEANALDKEKLCFAMQKNDKTTTAKQTHKFL